MSLPCQKSSYASAVGRKRSIEDKFIQFMLLHCLFEQKIKETTVQIYGILHSEARHIKANKSPQCNMPYIFAQPESLDKSWNDLFLYIMVPTTHLFVVSK